MRGGSDALFNRCERLNEELREFLDPELLRDENKKRVFDPNNPPSPVRAHLLQVWMMKEIFAKGLPPFAEFYVPEFLEGGQKDIDIHFGLDGRYGALDEKVLPTILAVARRMEFDPENQVFTLTDVTGHIYNPDAAEHYNYRNRIRENVVPRLRSIGIWTVEEQENDNLRIEAGPTLRDFCTYILAYWAWRQAQFFGALKWKGDQK